jgi:putative peptidoglycan lipid II flippase
MRLNIALGWLAATNMALNVFIQWYVVTRLGLGPATDALFAGMAVPQLVVAVVSGSLMHVLVPLLANEEGQAFGEAAWGFFLGITSLFSLMAIVLFVFTPTWVGWLLPGFTAEARAQTVRLTRIQIPGMIFTAAVSVLWAAYHARNRFIWAELSLLLAGALTACALFPALPRFGVVAAAWASVGRGALQTALLLPGLGPWKRPEWAGSALREAWPRLRPLLAGTLYYKADPLVDRFLSSMAPTGGLSTFYVGQQIWGALIQIINKAIVVPMVPQLAVYARQARWADFRLSYRRRLAALGLLTGGGLAAFLLVGQPLLRLVVGHGGVTAQNVSALWWIMLALGGLLVGGTMGQITSTAFYAKGDTRTPNRLGIVTFSAYLPLKVGAFLCWGLTGMAAAISLFFLANLVLQWRRLDATTDPSRLNSSL